MKSQNYTVIRYDAEDNMVFDWVNLADHVTVDDEGNEVQEHLYAKTIFIGHTDSIDNYVEVEAPVND